ncbi:ABC transporter ATP-binding protein [bacterium]|nr:ABC transporter ATP-binding protein [bacterium]
METIVKIENLGKEYVIAEKSRYLALRDTFVKVLKLPVNLLKGKKFRKKEKFWALRDVNLEVKKGEVIGIIGRNGAGKSTLLKILSRITDPTEGKITYQGSVASLLEVGTGFHPELTGRENVFLNGSILGMSQKEISKKFNQILEFAGVEDFIDMPVKRYSSGMQVRLAFSVAAHLEADIMIIDEVLAVGDAEFQRKCLGKMDEVTRTSGRTIFFVSHDMGAIRRICTRAVVLSNGKVVKDGNVEEAISYYLDDVRSISQKNLKNREDRRGKGNVRFTGLHLENDECKSMANAISGEPVNIVLEYESQKNYSLKNCRVSIVFSDKIGQELFKCCTSVTHDGNLELPSSGKVKCRIDRLPFGRGDYLMKIFFEVNGVVEDEVDGGGLLEVLSGKFYKTGKGSPQGWDGKGVLVDHSWKTN